MKHFDESRSDDPAERERERRRVNVDLMLQIGDFGNKGETV